MSSETRERSQTQAFGAPAHQTWDDYERGCLATYRGGHHDEPELSAYQHGMATVFNVLRAEFPSMAKCKAADQLLAACEAAMRIEALWAPNPGYDEDGEGLALAMMRDNFEAAIAAARSEKGA